MNEGRKQEKKIQQKKKAVEKMSQTNYKLNIV